jgi:hypothetical protein
MFARQLTAERLAEARRYFTEIPFDSLAVVRMRPDKYIFRDAAGVEYRLAVFDPLQHPEKIHGFTVDDDADQLHSPATPRRCSGRAGVGMSTADRTDTVGTTLRFDERSPDARNLVACVAPYTAVATVNDGQGRYQETFLPGAFRYQVERAKSTPLRIWLT